MTETGQEDAKRLAGVSAAEVVADGMVVGLGTGSTTAYAIERLGERVAAGLDIRAIPTSFQSRQLARSAGIELTDLDDTTPDIAIDGADQVANGQLIKGGGAAHAREKVVDSAADRLLIVIDEGKRSERLDEPVPVEVLPAARATTAAAIEARGATPTVRTGSGKDGPVITDNGNFVLDCAFGSIDDPAELGTTLASIPGVVEHGLFVDLADEIHVGTADGALDIEQY